MLAAMAQIGENRNPQHEEQRVVPYKNHTLSIAEVRQRLSYDPLTGIFSWLVAPARNIRAGAEAGCIKSTRTSVSGKSVSYKYIRIGHEIPAQRLAWAIHYGEWPPLKILFEDGDSLNLRIANLRQSHGLAAKYDMRDPEQRRAYNREYNRLFPHVMRAQSLKKDFGITLADYAEMATAQDNKCAICNQPETEKRNGRVKALAVDHDHATGKIRGLLCTMCNKGLGKFKDNRDFLLTAIRYLDKHSGTENVVSLTVEKGA